MAIFQKKSTGDYYVDLYVNGRRKRWKVGPNKRQAELVEGKLKAEIAEDKYLDVKKDSNVTFAEFADRYIAEHSKVENKSWYEDEKRMGLLKEEFGKMPLSSIETKDIVQFKAKLLTREKAPGKKIRPATINRKLMLLKGMFSRAIEWGVFHRTNPCDPVKPLKENNQKERYLSIEEIKKLLGQCKKELLNVVEFALSTGMRAGEIVGLKWTDVDFKLELIYVRRSGKCSYSPKSGKNRAVPMNNCSRSVLMRCTELRNGESDEYVFSSRHWEGYKVAVARAELNPPGTSDLDKVVFHTLRHTFASHLAIQGVDLYRIAKLLGNSFQVVEKRYAHLHPKHLQEIRMIDNIWTPALMGHKQESEKVEARVAESADALDLKSSGRLNSRASSSLASGNASDGHHMDTKGDSSEKSLSENEEIPNRLKIRRGVKSLCQFKSGPGHFLKKPS